MKKIVQLFILLITVSVVSQEKLEEGVIKMTMKMSTDNAQAKAMFQMIGEVPITYYFKNNMSRTEQKHNMIGDNTTIIDNNKKKMLLLSDNPMAGKIYIEKDLNNSKPDDVTVSENNKTMTIAGYNCIGYDVVIKKGSIETKLTLFMTEKISAPTQNTVVIQDKIKGFPMLTIVNVNQGGIDMEVELKVTEVTKKEVDNNLFDFSIPDGFKKPEKPSPAGID
ncbi:uncharacterized protein DUF4412 [Lutibacter sp. Hel_I_33_5]|uniref:DUF4412 domain-containing protein n=1 Tax=Lutibacter sp. Hel_I_33_5 TaxID=1566289 RepID=UPI0011A99D90|nr:DUF4412 domain-containing protein [Lutibacter sp. Hel_I_33_5]TVZ56885.1 uncharacterized protein DUF4412 [Lutibacter sp. Hel_I_33_5]